jgi:hypothetical protein
MSVAHVNRIKTLYRRSLRESRNYWYRTYVYRCGAARYTKRACLVPVVVVSLSLSLLTSFSLCHIYRHHFKWITDQVRGQFEANRDLKLPREIDAKIEETEFYLYEFKHPDPIRCIDDIGGSRFQRVGIVPTQFLTIPEGDNKILA